MIKSIGVKVVSSRVKFHSKYKYVKYTFLAQTFCCENNRTVDAVAIGLCPNFKCYW